MTGFSNIALAARLAARDMRGGARVLRLLVAGVFIGAAAVALVGVTSQSLVDGARRGALESVGGDLSLRLFHRPPSAAEISVIRREGEVSGITELRPMARAVRSGSVDGLPVLVELKGIGASYPLYGAVEIQPAANLYSMLDQQDGVYGAVADPALFHALGVKPGDSVQIGAARYQLRGELIAEPDRAFRAFTLGPRLMVLGDSLSATGIVDEGAEVYFYSHVKLPPGVDAEAALARIDQSFPDAGWRMVNAHEGVPGVERTLSMAHVLLLFIGLGVMLVGGAGISGAVRAHVTEKMEVIAILKSIGAVPTVVTLTIGFEVLFAAGIGAVLGVGLGASGPALAAYALADQLPFSLASTPAAKPLLAAGLFGLLVALLFAWWPLMAVRDMNARVLLRDRATQTTGRLGLGGWLGAGGIVAALVLLVFWVSPMPLLTVAFLVGALALAAFYYVLGTGLSRFAKTLARGKGANVRLALSNLHRAGAPTGPVVMALGLSLTLLVALDGIGEAASRHVRMALPHSAPDVVAFSLKPMTAKQLETQLVASGFVERQRIVPFVHARVQAIGGVAVRDLEIPGSLTWVIRGDRGVSFAVQLPDGQPWSEGRDDDWLKQPGFSVDAGVAKKLNIGVGDMITLNIGGAVRTGPVLNFRTVDWTGLELDFPIIATPGTFAEIPHTYAASLKAKRGEGAALEAFVKGHFPDVPLIRVADVLQSLAMAMDAVVGGLKAAALMCGLAALVVLAGSVLQGLRERTNDIVLFKVLGARRRQLLGQLAMEFLGLGTLVALTAVPLGLGVAYGVVRAAGLEGVRVSWQGGITMAVAAVLVTLGVGLAVTLGAYTTVPARMLRNRRV